MEIIGGMAGRDRLSWGPVGFHQVLPDLKTHTAMLGACADRWDRSLGCMSDLVLCYCGWLRNPAPKRMEETL